ncbi:MAG: hypothetical protein ACM3Q2_14480 [Syntrophothermus sp.]
MDQAEKVYKNTQLLLSTSQQLSMPVMVTEQYPKGLGGTVAAIADHLGNHTRIEKTAFSACTEDTMQALASWTSTQDSGLFSWRIIFELPVVMSQKRSSRWFCRRFSF